MTNTPTAPANPWIGIFMLMAGAVCIGFAPIGLRWAVSAGVEPVTAAFWRYILALPFLATLCYFSRRGIGRPTSLALIAGVFFALDICLWHLALTRTSVANATFLVNLGSIGVGLLAWVFLRERPALLWAPAVVIALAGAWLLSSAGNTNGQTSLFGDALAIAAAIMVTVYLLAAKLARRQSTAVEVIFWATVAEAVVTALVAIGLGETLWIGWDSAGWPALLFLALVAHVGGQGLIVAGVGRAPTAIAGLIMLLQPVVAATFGFILFDETLTRLQIVGASLILVALGLSQMSVGKRPVKEISTLPTPK